MSEKIIIEDMQRIANERGGRCLSRKYLGAHTKLKWQCKEGHKWDAKPNHIKNGRWCPVCVTRTNEKVCRAYLEKIFKKDFSKIRPIWLKNEKGNQMELDGFCKELNLAFEYQGEQHYIEIPFFKKKKSLQERIKEDDFKKMLCEMHGINLIIIPYTNDYNKVYEIIISECRKMKINIPKHEKPNYEEFSIYLTSNLDDYKKIAKGKKGKLLSKVYFNNRTNLLWQCDKGHIWKARPSDIKNGHWCPICGGSHSLNIELMRAIAEKKGGKCLSSNYKNNKTHLMWQCKNGHKWEARPDKIVEGNWCPICFNLKRGKGR